jgi:hypothetical protein
VSKAHVHDWHELGRVFPFNEDDYDLERLSPDGGHVAVTAKDGTVTYELESVTHPDLAGKVPAPTFHVILQCQDPDCPEGPRHIEHKGLTKGEQGKLQEAYDAGLLDPDHDGTNRYISTLSLADLGLGRIQAMLGEGRTSGASEAAIAL